MLFAVGDHDDHALVVEEPAQAGGEDHPHDAEVEHQVEELTDITLLRGDRPGTGAVLLGGEGVGPPALEQAQGVGFHLVDRLVDHPGAVVLQTREVTRGADHRGFHRLVVLDGPRQDAADQGDQQQDVDGGEPRGGEDVEKLQAVIDLREAPVVLDVFDHVGFVEGPLWQQGARDGRDGQQEQQRQGGTHAGQPVPGLPRVDLHGFKHCRCRFSSCGSNGV